MVKLFTRQERRDLDAVLVDLVELKKVILETSGEIEMLGKMKPGTRDVTVSFDFYDVDSEKGDRVCFELSFNTARTTALSMLRQDFNGLKLLETEMERELKRLL